MYINITQTFTVQTNQTNELWSQFIARRTDFSSSDFAHYLDKVLFDLERCKNYYPKFL